MCCKAVTVCSVQSILENHTCYLADTATNETLGDDDLATSLEIIDAIRGGDARYRVWIGIYGCYMHQCLVRILLNANYCAS